MKCSPNLGQPALEFSGVFGAARATRPIPRSPHALCVRARLIGWVSALVLHVLQIARRRSSPAVFELGDYPKGPELLCIRNGHAAELLPSKRRLCVAIMLAQDGKELHFYRLSPLLEERSD